MKLFVVLRIFAFMLFVFTPSIAVMMFAAFVLKDTTYFQLLSLPALLINGLVVLAKPIKEKISIKIKSIASGK
jgi:hypothetical protein